MWKKGEGIKDADNKIVASLFDSLPEKIWVRLWDRRKDKNKWLLLVSSWAEFISFFSAVNHEE